ncbi:MAG: hypothetical protein II777_10360, partial [Clostridia bacterium]|nr:hypothetical protein [Clostridia bacterium]
ETVDNILKKKEKYDEKRKKRGRILSVFALVAVVAIIFTAVPLSIFIIARNAADPAETAKETAADTEVSLIEETAAPNPIKPTDKSEETGLPVVRLNYTENDKNNGTFILSGSVASGDLIVGSPVSDSIKRTLSIRYSGIVRVKVRASTDGGIELTSDPEAVFENPGDTVDFEFSYRYKEGSVCGRVCLKCDIELDGMIMIEPGVLFGTYYGFAAKINGCDFFTFYNPECEDEIRSLYRSAAYRFGDVITPAVHYDGGEYSADVPSFCLDPYMPDYYNNPACEELRMLFEAKPADITVEEAGFPTDNNTVFIGGTVGAPEGSYLAKTPGSLEGKQVIFKCYGHSTAAGIALTNEKGEFFISLDVGENPTTVGVTVEDGHDFVNDKSGKQYVSAIIPVKGGTAVDIGFYDRTTGSTPVTVKQYDRENGVTSVNTWQQFPGIMGNGYSLYFDISGKTDEGTVYTGFNIFTLFPSFPESTVMRAEVAGTGDVKILSGTAYERVEGTNVDHDVSFILPDGGKGAVLIYMYIQENGTERLGYIYQECLISSGGLLHRYSVNIYAVPNSQSNNATIKQALEFAEQSAGKDYAAQIAVMYAEAYRLKHSSESLDEYHSERLAEIENRLLSYGIAAPEIPSA